VAQRSDIGAALTRAWRTRRRRARRRIEPSHGHDCTAVTRGRPRTRDIMRIHQATLAAAVALSSVASPTATMAAALLFAGLGGWAKACAAATRRGHDRTARKPGWLLPRSAEQACRARVWLIARVAEQAGGSSSSLPGVGEHAVVHSERPHRARALDLPAVAAARARGVRVARPPPRPALRVVDCQAARRTMRLRTRSRCCKVRPARRRRAAPLRDAQGTRRRGRVLDAMRRHWNRRALDDMRTLAARIDLLARIRPTMIPAAARVAGSP